MEKPVLGNSTGLPLRGKPYVSVTDRKTKRDWAVFIKELADEHYPQDDVLSTP